MLEGEVLGISGRGRPRETFIKQACTDLLLQISIELKSGTRMTTMEYNYEAYDHSPRS